MEWTLRKTAEAITIRSRAPAVIQSPCNRHRLDLTAARPPGQPPGRQDAASPPCRHGKMPGRLLRSNYQGDAMNPTSPSRIPATLIPGDGIGPKSSKPPCRCWTPWAARSTGTQQAGMAGVAARRSAARRHVGQHPRAPAGAEGAADHAGRHGLPLIQCAPARGIRAVRQRPPGQHHRARPLREYRPGADPGKPGRLLLAHEFLSAGQRSARGGRLHRARRQRAHCRFAFEYAVLMAKKSPWSTRPSSRLTGLFLEACKHVAKVRGRVEVDDMIVDACAAQLVLNPWRFDMLLCTNLFGDICPTSWPAWSAAWAWRRPASAGMPPSSGGCTAAPIAGKGRG